MQSWETFYQSDHAPFKDNFDQYDSDLGHPSSTRMHRWVVRRKRKLLAASITLLLTIVFVSLTLQPEIRINEQHSSRFSGECSRGATKGLISDVCTNYTLYLAHGLHCPLLCPVDNPTRTRALLIEEAPPTAHQLSSSLRLDSCIHHSNTYVVTARMGNNRTRIVLKRKVQHQLQWLFENFQTHFSSHIYDRSETSSGDVEMYKTLIANQVASHYGKSARDWFLQKIELFFKLMLGKEVKAAPVSFLRSSLRLFSQPELLFLVMFQGERHFPKILGSCGPFYSVEYVESYASTFPEMIPKMAWHIRARIALNFLSLVESLEKSAIGPLYHCDVQEGNFGVTDNYQVKMIDVDLIYPIESMNEILLQPSCASDSDCNWFDCNSRCNVSLNKCTTQKLNNNLQLICRDIFVTSWPGTGLLGRYRPPAIDRTLSQLLLECLSDKFGQYSMSHPVVQTHLNILKTTLNQYTKSDG